MPERRVLRLVVSLDAAEKKLVYQLRIDQTPASPRESRPWHEPLVRPLVEGLIDFLERAMRCEEKDPAPLPELRRRGYAVYMKIFAEDVGKVLFDKSDPGAYLILELDRQLLWIPWELLTNNKEFLCERFLVSRQVEKTSEEFAALARNLREKRRQAALGIWGDIEGLKAKRERREIARAFELMRYGCTWLEEPSATDVHTQLTQGYTVVHFIGHGDYHEGASEKTGWCCHQGLLSCKDIRETLGMPVFPLLVFANSCHSARVPIPLPTVSEGYVGDLSVAFLEKGAPNYIGTLTQIPDERSDKFAKTFYDELRLGATIGEALGKSRLRFLGMPGPPIWAYYVHYGDPLTTLISEEQAKEATKREAEAAREIVSRKRRRRILLGLGVLSSLLVIASILAWRLGYFPRFPADACGVAVLDFEIQDMTTGQHQSVRVLEAEALRHDVAKVRLPLRLEIKNISRAFGEEAAAVHFARLSGAEIVIWGYGKKDKDGFRLSAVITSATPDPLAAEPWKPFRWLLLQEYGPGGDRFRKYYHTRLTKSEDFDALLHDVATGLWPLASVLNVARGLEQGRLKEMEETAISCAASSSGDPNLALLCGSALFVLFASQGDVEDATLLWPSIWSAAEEDDPRAWLDIQRAAEHMKNLILGLPLYDLALVNWPPLPGEAETLGEGILRAQRAMNVCLQNGNLRLAKMIAETSLQDMAAHASDLKPDEVKALTALVQLSLARIHLALGAYDTAAAEAKEIGEGLGTVSAERAIAAFALLGKYRETGDVPVADRASTVSDDPLRQSDLAFLRGDGAEALRKLLDAQKKGDTDRALLAARFIDAGVRTGDRAFVREGISTCEEGGKPTGLGVAWEQRECEHIVGDGLFFLGRADESLQKFRDRWSITRWKLREQDEASLLAMLGYVTARRFKDHAAALDLFRRSDAVGVIPINNLRQVLGQAYAATERNDPEEAIRILRLASVVEAGFPLGNEEVRQHFLAWAYARAGMRKEARNLLAALTSSPRVDKDIALGLALQANGELDRAADAYRRSLAHADADSETRSRAYFYLAVASLESGNATGALDALRHLSGIPDGTGPAGACPADIPHRYAELGRAWDPRLCRERQHLATEILIAERELVQHPAAVELRDRLVLLYEIARTLDGGIGQDEREKALIEEAIRLDARDAVNAPGLGRTPARRFIDLAVLALRRSKPDDALRALRNCVAWYAGDRSGDIWSLEAAVLLDEQFGVTPSQEKFPPWYAPTLTWPRYLQFGVR